jgi:hypothetical protein
MLNGVPPEPSLGRLCLGACRREAKAAASAKRSQRRAERRAALKVTCRQSGGVIADAQNASRMFCLFLAGRM